MAAWNSDEYKAAKEAFVSNLNGTSIWEIILVTVPLPVGLWAYAEMKVRTLACRSAWLAW
jgi:hypothetical protein